MPDSTRRSLFTCRALYMYMFCLLKNLDMEMIYKYGNSPPKSDN